MGRPALLVSFMLAILMLGAHEVLGFQRIPKPQTFMHAVWIWVVLGIISELGLPEISAVFGIGLVIAMAYTYFTTKTPLLVPSDNATSSNPSASGQSGFGGGVGVGAGAGGGGGGSF